MKYLSILLIAFFSFLSSCTKYNDPTPTAQTSTQKPFNKISAKAWHLKVYEENGDTIPLTPAQTGRSYIFNPSGIYQAYDGANASSGTNVVTGAWTLDENYLTVTVNGVVTYNILV